MEFEEFKNKILSEDKELAREYYKTQIPFEIAKKVMSARIGKGLSQTELARKIGTKQPSIARIESGVYSTSLATLRKLSAVLGIEFIISELKRKEGEREDFDFKLELEDPEGKKIAENEREISLGSKYKRTRTKLEIDGIRITGPGTYIFRIKKKGNGKYKTCAEIPLEISFQKKK